MKLRMLAAGLVALGLMSAASANAAITVTLPNVANQLNSATGQAILWDFDGPGAANTLYTGTVRNLVSPGQVSDSAPPPWDPGPLLCCAGGNPYHADNTNYGSVQDEDDPDATFVTLNGYALSSFSFYMGSPDLYNSVIFHFVGGGPDQQFMGDAIWGGTLSGQPGDGDRTKGFRVYYNFNGALVDKITFGSTQDAFEFDGLAGNLVAVPEPATWGLMIMGFGAAGAMLRRRRTVTA